MLSPDKIASEEFFVDMDRINNENYSEMKKVKEQIEKNGRVNEITLEGRKVCEQHIVHQETNQSEVHFSTQNTMEMRLQSCVNEDEKEGQIVVSGDITAQVTGAKYYLVQLVDSSDTTIIPKQCLLPSTEQSYTLTASLSDFPDTSLGPYQVSTIALGANNHACSAVIVSELKIPRYNPPDRPSVTLPNFDVSDSDVVTFEWNHPTFIKEQRLVHQDEHSAATEEKNGAEMEAVIESARGSEPDLSTPSPEARSATETLVEMESVESTGEDEPNLSTPPQELQSVTETSHETSDVDISRHTSADSSSGQKLADHDLQYRIMVTGSYVKKRKRTKKEKVTIEGIEGSKDFFYTNSVPQSQENVLTSLNDILKQRNYDIEDGILFQSQIFISGHSQLHSVPKLFPDFILLAPPAKLKAYTSIHIAGLSIDWEYGAHAVGYRVELVDESTNVVFSKVLKRCRGCEGTDVLLNKDFRDIPNTNNSKGLQLQMYSLGFGDVLIRCLKPAIARGRFHVLRDVRLQYLTGSGNIRVSFKPQNSCNDYVVSLYKSQPDIDIPSVIVTKNISQTRVYLHPLEYGHILQSGDSVGAWIYSKANADNMYMGASQQEMLVLDTPKLQSSLVCHLDGTVKGLQLTWSDVYRAQEYECGIVTSYECATHSRLQETEWVLNFESSSLSNLTWGGYCQFRVYVKAHGKPGMLGALSYDTNQLQCINVTGCNIVFTATQLQSMWTHYIMLHFHHYHHSCGTSSLFVYPTGEQFPRINIPMKFKRHFWQTNSAPFFGNDVLYARDILTIPDKSEWVRIDPFTTQTNSKRPGVKSQLEPKATIAAFRFSELHLLFYTRCFRKSTPGKRQPKIKLEAKRKTMSKKATKDAPAPSKATKKSASSVDKQLADSSADTRSNQGDNKQKAGITESSRNEERTGKTTDTRSTERDDEHEPAEYCTTESNVNEQTTEGTTNARSTPEHEPIESSNTIKTAISGAPLPLTTRHEEDNDLSRSTDDSEAQPCSGPNLDIEEPVTEDGNICGENEGGLSGIISKGKNLLKAGTEAGKDMLKAGIHSAKKVFGLSDGYDVVYEKSTTIELPHGTGPKTYCRMISFKPDHRQYLYMPSLQPVFVTVTIKPSDTKNCWNEDTHLFVRFSDYNSLFTSQ